MTDWIEQMTWQDWIDRAALREQMTARLVNNVRVGGACQCSAVEVAVRVRWGIEFKERLRKRTALPVPEGDGE